MSCTSSLASTLWLLDWLTSLNVWARLQTCPPACSCNHRDMTRYTRGSQMSISRYSKCPADQFFLFAVHKETVEKAHNLVQKASATSIRAKKASDIVKKLLLHVILSKNLILFKKRLLQMTLSRKLLLILFKKLLLQVILSRKLLLIFVQKNYFR